MGPIGGIRYLFATIFIVNLSCIETILRVEGMALALGKHNTHSGCAVDCSVIGHVVHQRSNQSCNHAMFRSFDRSIVRSFDRSIIVRSFDRSIVRSFDRSIVRSFDRSIVRSFDHSIIQSIIHPSGHSTQQY